MSRLKNIGASLLLAMISLNVMSQDTNITLGSNSLILNYAGVPIFTWFPDGHIAVLKERESDQYAMYWAGSRSYRTTGEYAYPDYQLNLNPANSIFGAKTDVDSWDNGGSWLMSVFRINEDTLVGFYHAEDHYYGSENPGNIAWKSLGRTMSYDNGLTWQPGEQIITSNTPKPATPEWGGAGDNSVIWDEANQRWLCYYQEQNIMLAMSEDRLGRPGTWYKYYEGSFSEPGLTGLSSQLDGLVIAGGNPSIHFNEYLNKYVIVYHGWNRNIYLSTSPDGINWQYPELIVAPSGQRRVWYPTIIGESDVLGGKVARLYYADMSSDLRSRSFISRAIIFDDVETFKPLNWSFEKIGSFLMKGSIDSLSNNVYRILSFEGSLDENATYGYHYRTIEGDFGASFTLSIDSDYPGVLGCAIRAGVNDSDEEVVFAYNGQQILLKNGTELIGSLVGDSVTVLLEKKNEELTLSYKNEEDKWVIIHTTPWNRTTSLLGFFSVGSPNQPVMGYVSDYSFEPYIPLGVENMNTNELIIYPNPIRDSINITNRESVRRVVLMNLDGQIVQNTTNWDNLAVRDLVNGIYLIKIIRTNGQIEYHKVIIEK